MMYRCLLFACLLLSLPSCRNEFTLEGEFQDTPVAYGYLDADDDRHFVRVEQAFLEAGGNAETNAGDPATIYYAEEDAVVVVRNLTTGNDRQLARVDARDFGIDRAEGIFATNPNLAYSFTDDELSLNGGDELELRIERPGEETAVATTTVLEQLDIVRPGDEVRIDNPARPLILTWTKGPAASIYDVRFFISVRELFPGNADMNRDVRLEWQLATGYVPGDDEESGANVRFVVDPEGFYRFLGANLAENDDVVRRFQHFDVQVSAAGEEVLELRTLQNANTGLTSSGSLPRYTNLEGGIGLFTSQRTTLKEGVNIDRNSVDSLRFGQFTRNLGFN